ncbi:MAG: PTS sugar transporter subunit IIA [Balneolaceae bacterium]
MQIFTLLSDQTVLPNLTVKNKDSLLNKLIDVLKHDVDEQQLEEIRNAVLEREEIMSTGVGKGLAIPHGKAKGLDANYASFAILDRPVEYESIDDEPVRLVFLLVGPESENSTHIKLLSRISRLMNNVDFRKKLYSCASPEEILNTFREEEELYFKTN